MALRDSRAPEGQSVPPLPFGPPYSCTGLTEWAGFPFWMPPSDPRLLSIHRGEAAPTPPLENLAGMVKYWCEHPEWMNMMSPQSPVYSDKLIERAIYLHYWGDYLKQAHRVLDLGGGVGRMMQHCLSLGAEVELVDPDLRSLWRAVNLAVGKPGKLDVHWSTGEAMPALSPVDLVLACEVFNYVEDPDKIVTRIHETLKPGGIFLLSVEARWGWAMSSDVAEGSLDAFFEDGVIHIPQDRWIRTYTKEDVQKLLSSFNIEIIVPSHYAFSGPFQMAAGEMSPERAIALEQRLREHPVAGNLNRAWIAVARKEN